MSHQLPVVQALGVERARGRSGIEVGRSVLLCPLTCQDRSCRVLANSHVWNGRKPRLTFQEFLAGVFFEECFMSNGTAEVVDHELEDRFDLILTVSSVMGNGGTLTLLATEKTPSGIDSTYPFTSFEDETCQIHRPGSDLARREFHEAMVE